MCQRQVSATSSQPDDSVVHYMHRTEMKEKRRETSLENSTEFFLNGFIFIINNICPALFVKKG